MENMLYDKPGIIILKDRIAKSPKVKKWISKNNPSEYKVIYLEKDITDRSQLDRELKILENTYLGIDTKQKETIEQRPYRYVYRSNLNTIYCAYTLEDLYRLLLQNDVKFIKENLNERNNC